MATTAIYGVTKPVVAGDSGIWGGELNTGLDTWDNEIARSRIPFLSPTVAATTTLDLNQTTGARVFAFTVSQATTIAFSNIPSASFFAPIWLKITNGGAFVLTWPASVKWLSTGTPGIAPTLLASGVDWVQLVTLDAGTTWYASSWRPSDLFILDSAGATVFNVNTSAGSRALQSRAGASTTLALPVAVPSSTGTDSGTTSSGAGSPVNLKSYAIPAAMLNGTNVGVRIRGVGTGTNNANAKAVRVALGATLVLSQTLQVSVGDFWEVELVVLRTGATTADCWAWGLTNGTSAKTVQFLAVTGLADWSATGNTVQFSCTQTSAADVTQEGQLVEWLGT